GAAQRSAVLAITWHSPPGLVELGLDRADVAPGALGAYPPRPGSAARLDDVRTPAQGRVTVSLRIGRPRADRADLVHALIVAPGSPAAGEVAIREFLADGKLPNRSPERHRAPEDAGQVLGGDRAWCRGEQ